MREHVMILGVVWLGLYSPLVPITKGRQTAQEPCDKGSATRLADSKTSLRMTAGIVCRSIDGYEDYERLPDAAQTSDEKLLVYFRPLDYQSELIDGLYHVHLVPDFQIRKRGEKAILRQKQKIFEYKPKSEEPLRGIYLKNVIALKGLAPGDYDLTIILHDEIAKGPPATQVVKFRIIPAIDPQKKEGLPQNLWALTQLTSSAPARQEGSPSLLHHRLAPFG